MLQEPDKKKMVITGGCGFIGSNMAHHFAKSGEWDVFVFDDMSRGRKENIKDDSITIIEGSGERLDDCLYAFEGADTVIHLAAKVGGIGYYEEKPFSVCLENTLIDTSVILGMIMTGVNKFVYASTTHVYPHELQTSPDSPPLKESDAGSDPLLSYGLEKLYIEKLLSLIDVERDDEIDHDIPNLGIARYCGIYGSGQDTDLDNASLLPALCKRASMYPEVPYQIRGDGRETRSYCYIDDAIEATEMMLNKMETERIVGPYNVGSDEKFTVMQIAEKIANISGKDMMIQTQPEIVANIMGQSCDLETIKSELGWYPKTTLDEGLIKIYNDVKERVNYEKVSTNTE